MIDEELDRFKRVRHDRHGEHQARNPRATLARTTSSGADKSRASSCTSPLYIGSKMGGQV